MKLIKIIYLLLFLLICQINIVLAQKKNIDSNAYTRWSSVIEAGINIDGKYACYTIENEPIGHKTFILQSTENDWRRSYNDISSQRFLSTKKTDYAIILDQNDHLMMISLGKDLVQSIGGVSSFSVFQNEESEWIVYELKGLKGKIILQNLNTGKKYTYENVINKVLGDDGQTIVLQTEMKVNNQIVQELSWINLKIGKKTLIWKGLKAKGIILDSRHDQLAFICENGLFSYSMITNKLNFLINNHTSRLDSGLKFEGIKRFSHDGDRLFIELKEENKQKPKPGLVEVWSYLDSKLQSQQENETEARIYAAVVNLMDGKIIRLEQEFEYLVYNSFEDISSDTIRLITHDARDNGDGYNIYKSSHYLISLKNGKRIQLKYPADGLSPSGKYLVYFDPEQRNYMSYNIRTGICNVISKPFPETYIEQGFYERRAIAGWLENDEGVLFYYNYDIWRMDLSGQKKPVNLTEGYGKIHHLAFSMIYGRTYPFPLRKNQKILLLAFDLKSKKNGFYSLELDKVKGLKLLSMENYLYCAPYGVEMDNYFGHTAAKAQKAEVYLVNRMNARNAPNYFSTVDFKTFKALSNVHPEREYKWYTTELHTWTSLDGKSLQGILYKPKDFDPNKKYPIIFNYYESKSNNLNAYIKPEDLCNGCVINIPTYLSNGYLVFTPDIVYKTGDPMQGAYDAVVSAAKYISSFFYVNAKKIGIQGCSFGGVQTNYLVTHTNLFAAACSASGVADWISHSGRLFPNGYAIRGVYETGQFRMGRSVWEIPDAYIKSSAIFQLDKVTTPFLIMHTKKDAVCPYEDAIELFTGLRRLGKKSWMLVYPDENHGIFDEKKARDFSIRMMQFFDHYLKDKPAPIWMTTPIPAEKRGRLDDLAYDTKIKTPGPGLLNPEEQRMVDSIMVRKPIMIELK